VPKYRVIAPAVFVDHESGRVRDRKRYRGEEITLKAAQAKPLLDAGAIAELKAKKKAKE